MDIFSNFQVIGECLLDKKRTLLFRKAIIKATHKDSVVLDAGTGSGIMAMIAAKAGAKQVFGIEIAPDIAKSAADNVRNNNFNNIEIINNDIVKFSTSRKINLVIMEMLDTALASEQQCHAINNLVKSNIINSDTTVIPLKLDSYFQLINYDFDFYGLKMPFIIQADCNRALNRVNSKISKNILFDSVMFNKTISEKVSFNTSLSAKKNAIVNAILITSKTFLDSKISTWGTSDMCMPVILPLQPLHVQKNDSIKVELSYSRSLGFDNFNVRAINERNILCSLYNTRHMSNTHADRSVCNFQKWKKPNK